MPSLEVSLLSGAVYTVRSSKQGRVEDLKRAIECATGILVDEQRLISISGELSDRNDLAPLLQPGVRPMLTLLRRDPLQAFWLKNVAVGKLLSDAPPEIRADKEVVLSAMQQNGLQLQYASAELRGDREVVLSAIQQHGRYLQYASAEVRGDREVVLSAVQQSGMQLEFASTELRGDRELVLVAMRQGGSLLDASLELRADREVVLAAVQSARCNAARQFSFACEALKANREFVLELLRRKCDVLPSASADLKADGGVVLSAMQHAKCCYEEEGSVLNLYMHASSDLRDDRDFLFATVRCCDSTLRNAGEDVRALREQFWASIVDLAAQGPPEVPSRRLRSWPWYDLLLNAARKDVFRDAAFQHWALAAVLDLVSMLQDHAVQAHAAKLPPWLRVCFNDPTSLANWGRWFQANRLAACADHKVEHELRRQRAACRKVARGARVAAKKARTDREVVVRPSMRREACGRRRPERRAAAAFARHFDLAATVDGPL